MLLIMGRTATGKSTLADALASHGMLVFGRKDDNGNIIDETRAQAMVVDIDTMKKMAEEKGAAHKIAYLIAKEDAARATMATLMQGTDEDAPQRALQKDAEEKEAFDELEEQIRQSAETGKFMLPLGIAAAHVYINDYQLSTLEETCARIALDERVHNNVKRILTDCAEKFGDIRSAGEGTIICETSDGNFATRTIEEVCDSYISRPELLGPVMLAWLTHVDITNIDEPMHYANDIIIGSE